MTRNNRFIILAVAFIAMMVSALFLTAPAKAEQSGEWEGLSWTFSDAGCLTISGSETRRAIPDFNDNENNWLWKVLDQTLIKTVVIENGVTYIGDAAFINCSNLTSITIPGSVMEIGEGSFKGCSSLTGVTIPAGQPYICSRTFYGCSSLASITIPTTVKSIGQSAFYGCSSLTDVTIPDSVTGIYASAFQNCSGLTSLMLPESLVTIGKRAFQNSFKSPTSSSQILPNIMIPDGVTSVGENAFAECHATRFANIGSEGAKALGKAGYMFMVPGQKYNLQYLYENDTIAGLELTSAMSDVTSIEIAAGVTSIKGSALNGCRSLTSVTIPNSVTSIGPWAFQNCSSLTNCKIPETVTNIGEDAFKGCVSQNISVICCSYADTYFGENTPVNRIHDLASATYSWAADHSTCTASATCRRNPSHVVTVTVATTVQNTATCTGAGQIIYTAAFTDPFTTQTESVGSEALNHDWGEVRYEWAEDYSSCKAERVCRRDAAHTETETVTPEATVVTPATEASEGLMRYTATFTNPAFPADTREASIPKLQPTTLPEGPYSDPEGTGNYHIGSDGTAQYSAPPANATAVVIPESITVNNIPVPVVTVADKAFYKNTKIKTITIGKNIKTIGTSAFSGCKALMTVKGCANVVTIKDNAFNGCVKLKTLPKFAKLVTIGKATFKGCKALTEIKGCTKVKAIGKDAFNGCLKLKTIPAFTKLEAIGDTAFKGCKALTKLTLSANVKKIGKEAYSGCAALKTITIKTTKLTSKNVGANAFKGISKKAKTTCPKSKLKAYKKFLPKRGIPANGMK